jgi:hypothetical protein
MTMTAKISTAFMSVYYTAGMFAMYIIPHKNTSALNNTNTKLQNYYSLHQLDNNKIQWNPLIRITQFKFSIT